MSESSARELDLDSQLFALAYKNHSEDPSTPTLAIAGTRSCPDERLEAIRTEVGSVAGHATSIYHPLAFEVESNGTLILTDQDGNGGEFETELSANDYVDFEAVYAGTPPERFDQSSTDHPQMVSLPKETLEFIVNRAAVEQKRCREHNLKVDAPEFVNRFDDHMKKARHVLNSTDSPSDDASDSQQIQFTPAVTNDPDFRWAPDPTSITVTGSDDEGNFWHDTYVHSHAVLEEPIPDQ